MMGDSKPSRLLMKSQPETVLDGPALESPRTPLVEIVRNHPIFCGSSVLLALAALGAIVLTIVIVVISYSPVPFADHLVVLSQMGGKTPWYSVRLLWKLHNEHRIPLVRLAIAADLFWFGGHSRLLFSLTLLLLASHLAMWAAFLRAAIKLPFLIWLSIVSFFAFSIFSPTQFENLIMPFQCDFVGAFVFASASFITLVWATEAGRPVLAVAVSGVCAFLSECCLASGLLTWPVLLAASFTLRFTKRQRAILTGSAAVAIFLYLRAYHQPRGHSQPLESLMHPGQVFDYLLTYYGHELSSYCTFPDLATVILVAAGLTALVLVLRDRATRQVGTVLAMTTLFLLGTSLITALGRIVFGPGQASSSRYQACVMLFWACLFAALFLLAWKHCSWRDLTALNIVALGVILIPLPYLRPFLGGLRDRAAGVKLLGQSLDQGLLDPVVQNPVSLSTLSLPLGLQVTSFLHGQGKRLMPDEVAAEPSLIARSNQNKNLCKGSLDIVVSVGRVFPGPPTIRAEGWAMNVSNHRPASMFIVADQEGNVLGASDNHFTRADVSQGLAGADPNELYGWQMYVPLRQQSDTVTAYAIVDGHACPLGTSYTPAH
jgi:hypothetical protein